MIELMNLKFLDKSADLVLDSCGKLEALDCINKDTHPEDLNHLRFLEFV